MGNLRKLLLHELEIKIVGYNQDIFRRAYPLQAIEGILDQGMPRAQNIVKLLGEFGAAHRPKAASDAAGHNNAVVVRSGRHISEFSVGLVEKARLGCRIEGTVTL